MTSEIFYKSIRVLCEDGKTRSVRVKCYRYDGSFAADTYFSVPAHCRIKGRYVAGYVTGGYDGLEFRAMNTHKALMIGRLLPPDEKR